MKTQKIKKGAVYREVSKTPMRRLKVTAVGHTKSICLILVGPNAKVKNAKFTTTVANSTLTSKRYAPSGGNR